MKVISEISDKKNIYIYRRMDEKHPVHFFPLTVSLSLPSFFFFLTFGSHMRVHTHTNTHIHTRPR